MKKVEKKHKMATSLLTGGFDDVKMRLLLLEIAGIIATKPASDTNDKVRGSDSP